jgi:hypothetical protein
MPENKELAKLDDAPRGFDRFIEMAIEKAVPVETLERLLAMQKDIMATNAKAAYDEAMRNFQAACPVIQKHKKVLNKDGHSVRYIYAPLDDIIEQVKALLAGHGFSYRLGQEVDKPKPNWLTVYCTATHAAGHSETEKFELPLGAAQFMTAQQEVGAARTFGSRYCFLGVFGIMTGDEDTDTNPPAENKKPAGAPAPGSANKPTQSAGTKPASPAPQPPTQNGDKLTTTGLVVDLVAIPMPAKIAAWKTANKKFPDESPEGYEALAKAAVIEKGYCRFKVLLQDNPKAFYTFDKKIAALVDKEAMNGPATIVYHVGKYGQDIDSLTFAHMPCEQAPALDEYAGELEEKK